jgi:cytochrome P450
MRTTVPNHTSVHPAPLPPGPKGWPLIGCAPQFGRDPLGFLDACARAYGDVVRLGFGRQSVYMISHPDQVEEVLVTNNRNFCKEPIQPRYMLEGALFGAGLVTSDGAFWLRQRRLAQPAFHRKRIESYAETMAAYTDRMLAGWRDGQSLDIHEEMMRLTLEIVAKTLFDADVTGDAAQVGLALNVMMHVIAEQLSLPFQIPIYIPTPGNRRFVRAMRRLDELITEVICRRRASGADTGDLLSMLLQARDDDGSGMTDQQLRDELVTMFVAGHETTALSLSWTWYLLAQHPEVEARLAEELEIVLGGRAPILADLPRLRYTEMVLKESMRLYPPAWILSGRIAVEDCRLGGYHVPAGTLLLLSPWVTQRDGRFFTEPERFIPERWEDDLEKQLPRFAYFPFGGGSRMCIGQAFAMMEAKLLLAAVAQRFRLDLTPGQTIVPQPSITLRPKHGVKMTLMRR